MKRKIVLELCWFFLNRKGAPRLVVTGVDYDRASTIILEIAAAPRSPQHNERECVQIKPRIFLCTHCDFDNNV